MRGKLLPWVAFAVDAAAHLVLQWVAPVPPRVLSWVNITQWLLMPLLAWALLATARRPLTRLVRWTLIALGLCFLGDTLPAVIPGTAGFLSMMLPFLAAQIAFTIGFWPFRALSFLRTRRYVLLGYVAALLALVWWCHDGAGNLFVPVLLYGCCVTLTAVLASGIGRVGAIGGAAFFVSDSLLALSLFDGPTPSHNGFWVMVTYIVANTLLVRAALKPRPLGD